MCQVVFRTGVASAHRDVDDSVFTVYVHGIGDNISRYPAMSTTAINTQLLAT
jgi:hypothetical protein